MFPYAPNILSKTSKKERSNNFEKTNNRDQVDCLFGKMTKSELNEVNHVMSTDQTGWFSVVLLINFNNKTEKLEKNPWACLCLSDIVDIHGEVNHALSDLIYILKIHAPIYWISIWKCAQTVRRVLFFIGKLKLKINFVSPHKGLNLGHQLWE